MQNDKHCPITHEPCRQDCAWLDEMSKLCAVLLLAQRFDAVTTTEDELTVNTGKPLSYYLEDEESCSHT